MGHSTRLQECAVIIKAWLSQCLTEHAGSACCSIIKGAGPKRLVHLPLGNQPGRLVDVLPTAAPPYVALSYVWGPPGENLKTTRANLGEMRETIPDDRLPRTLRQVFDLVRMLEVEYLWIDALCIIQDDAADKAAEISNMGLIYRNSLLQIAAMASHGAASGLLPPVRAPLTTEEKAKHHLIMKACRSLRQSDWDGVLRRDYPLLKRGWPFQERILARRIIHFTQAELVWECKCTRICECGDIEDGTGDGASCNLINNFSAAFEACVTAGEKSRLPLAKVVPMWRECVMSYSKRDLTQEDDRLLAISGIARLLRGPESERLYLAGLWMDAMPFDLLWRCDASSGLDSAKTRRPTWSWWSVGCGVDWPSAQSRHQAPPQTTDPDASLEYIASGRYFEQKLAGVSVTRAQLEPENAGFELVNAGSLELEARTVDVDIQHHSENADWTKKHETEWTISAKNGQVLPFYPDTRLSGPIYREEGYRFVEIANCVLGQAKWEAGLVVQASENDPGVFERVGMAGYADCSPQTKDDGFFSDAAVQKVVLV